MRTRVTVAEAIRRFAGKNESVKAAIKMASVDGTTIQIGVARGLGNGKLTEASRVKCPACKRFGAIQVKLSKSFPEDSAYYCPACRATFVEE